MMFRGCQGKKNAITIHEKACPECGNLVELFSIDTKAVCDKCGFVVYNDTLSCVQWCQYARQCVGDEMYEQMLKVLEQRKRAKEEVA